MLSYDENLHTFSYLLFSTFAEYEGSPRRIGQMGNNSNNDEDHHHHRANSKLQTNVINKTNHHNAISTTSTGGATATAAAATANNSPKQHYAARPGFPQVSFLIIYETRKADGRTEGRR